MKLHNKHIDNRITSLGYMLQDMIKDHDKVQDNTILHYFYNNRHDDSNKDQRINDYKIYGKRILKKDSFSKIIEINKIKV